MSAPPPLRKPRLDPVQVAWAAVNPGRPLPPQLELGDFRGKSAGIPSWHRGEPITVNPTRAAT